MNQIPITTPMVYSRPSYNYNGVKIDIHNPQAGVQPPQQEQVAFANPVYRYPQGCTYAKHNPIPYPIPYMPNCCQQVVPVAVAQPQCQQNQTLAKPVTVDDTASKISPTVQQASTVVPPAPKVLEGPHQVINNNVATPVAAPKDTMDSVEAKAIPSAVKADDKSQSVADNKKDTVEKKNELNSSKVDDTSKVKVINSEEISAKLRGNLVNRLQSNDTDVQSKALIEIANAAQQINQVKNAIDLKAKQAPDTLETKAIQKEYDKTFNTLAGVVLDEKVVESILAVLVKDNSSLEGPTPKQIQLRTKEMQGKKLTADEENIANKLSPLEKAEQNKEFALFTLRLVQEMYMEGIEKMSGKQPDLKDVPGVEQMVITVKSNPNPAIRAAAISAITHNPREQDKEILNTILRIASEQDADEGVRNVASQSLVRINNTQKAKA